MITTTTIATTMMTMTTKQQQQKRRNILWFDFCFGSIFFSLYCIGNSLACFRMKLHRHKIYIVIENKLHTQIFLGIWRMMWARYRWIVSNKLISTMIWSIFLLISSDRRKVSVLFELLHKIKWQQTAFYDVQS